MTGLRFGGVPLHPALVHFPVAAWTASLLADGGFLLTGEPFFWAIAYWSMAIGIVIALVAMTAGFVDFVKLGSEHPAWDAVQRHMLLMGSAWSVFVLDLLLRSREAPDAMPWWLAGITLLGFVLLMIGGHLGGRLVYQHGVGVHRDAQ